MASTDPPGRNELPRETPAGGLHLPAAALLLRVAEAAWNELGVPSEERKLPATNPRSGHAAPSDAYVRQFWAKCRSPDALGTVATSLHSILPGLYRVSVGAEPRAIIWHDAAGGVLWLCAGLSAPEGDRQHRALYQEVERRRDNDELLPTTVEREAARAEAFWFGVVDELAFALRSAHQRLGEWTEAHVDDVQGRKLRYARFYAEEEEFPGEGVIRLRYMVVLRRPPEGVPHPPYWQEVLIAELFPDGGELKYLYADDVPHGAELRPEDVIFLHESEVYEELSEDDADEDNPPS